MAGGQSHHFGASKRSSLNFGLLPLTVLEIGPIKEPGLFNLEPSLPSLHYQLESRSRIGNQFFYVLVVLQLAISVGSLLGSHSLRSAESTVLEERAALT